jgi:hypothetical protein
MHHRTAAALASRSIALLAAMQSGNLARTDNIAGMDHTSTKWSVRLEQGRSHNRVLRNRVLHSREQSLKPCQGNRDQGRLRIPHSNLRHAILLRIHSFLYSDIGQAMVQRTTLATLLQ